MRDKAIQDSRFVMVRVYFDFLVPKVIGVIYYIAPLKQGVSISPSLKSYGVFLLNLINPFSTGTADTGILH